MENILNLLNDRQREAVTATEGPLLVVAGAGSGKTTVLVDRIAYIIDRALASPYQILAITFTNKAANEMKSRISDLLPGFSNDMWIGTFHSICVKILRCHINLIGYENDFVIYDTADVKTVMKECYRELDIDEKNFPQRSVSSIISNAKNDSMDFETFESVYKTDFRMSVVSKIYTLYQSKLIRNNALDFDDIILNTVKLLSENPDILQKYQNRFKYILVDEYQDTNNIQYILINMLADGYKNICVVGDDDQSIYKFRGANIGNILSFESDYENARRITLEQNYRSTQNILDAANAVIANNNGRMGKDLWTANGDGEKINTFISHNEHDEGNFIAKEIKKHHDNGGNYSDCAILYRTNVQSRVIEEMLMRNAVPYRVLAGLRFYDRKEIKDIIAYLRLIHNPHDDVSLKRIINEPKRQIGNATVDKLTAIAMSEDCSIYDIIKNAALFEDELKSSIKKLTAFYNLAESLIALKDTITVTQLITHILNDTGYLAMLQLDNSVENQTRCENIDEFMNVAAEFEQNQDFNGTLSEFLESVTLVSDIDSYDEDEDAAVMMTIHSAKGLEFPIVFLVGMEEGLFPGMRSLGNKEDIEEERRLCYVAITRAKQKLYITRSESRTVYGKTQCSQPSRFFKEIPEKYLEPVKPGFFKKKTSPQHTFGRSVGEFLSSMPKTVKQQEASGNITFNKGDRVMHRKFGSGTVISVKQFGNDAVIEIDFDSIGYKPLMAAFARLEKIN